jgi:hypothetical protein
MRCTAKNAEVKRAPDCERNMSDTAVVSKREETIDEDRVGGHAGDQIIEDKGDQDDTDCRDNGDKSKDDGEDKNNEEYDYNDDNNKDDYDKDEDKVKKTGDRNEESEGYSEGPEKNHDSPEDFSENDLDFDTIDVDSDEELNDDQSYPQVANSLPIPAASPTELEK